MIDRLAIVTKGYRSISRKRFSIAVKGYYLDGLIDVVHVEPQIIEGSVSKVVGYSLKTTDINKLLKPKDNSHINEFFHNLDRNLIDEEEVKIIVQTYLTTWENNVL